MYNHDTINRLVTYIHNLNGLGDKEKLSLLVKKEFDLTQDRKVFYSPDFAIRFSKSKSKRISNTVLSLSALQKYDDKPFIVCVVTPETNHMMLANTTFLKKISHSSQELRVDNIRGSFNGSDIMLDFDSIENEPVNFQRLFAYHEGFSFQDNLERLVESTNNIVGRNLIFSVSPVDEKNILTAVDRAERFLQSPEYNDLNNDLDNRVSTVQGEIAIAAFIDNVNMRGRVIEYLITDDGSTLKDKIVDALHSGSPLPTFKTGDKLGDYFKIYPSYVTETDIKTKVLFLNGNPKAYNIDKLLEFLSTQKSVYMIYLLGIDEHKNIVARLISAFDERLIGATNLQQHWAGRKSRGVAQFNGKALVAILEQENGSNINHGEAKSFLKRLIDAGQRMELFEEEQNHDAGEERSAAKAEIRIFPTNEAPSDDVIMLPLIGEIAAGHEHFMDEDVEGYIATEKRILSPASAEKYFYLRVSGDSMTGADIHDGDIVLIRRSSRPQSGDIVAAMTDGDTATLKTLLIYEDRVELQPQNDAYKPYVLDPNEFRSGTARILGVMVR